MNNLSKRSSSLVLQLGKVLYKIKLKLCTEKNTQLLPTASSNIVKVLF